MPCRLASGKSACRKVLRFGAILKSHPKSDLVLQTRLTVPGYAESGNTTFLTAPRRVAFPRPTIRLQVRRGAAPGEWEVGVRSPVFAYQVYLNLAESVPHRFEDNFFDLFPGEARTLTLRLEAGWKKADVQRLLIARSYRDAHAE